MIYRSYAFSCDVLLTRFCGFSLPQTFTKISSDKNQITILHKVHYKQHTLLNPNHTTLQRTFPQPTTHFPPQPSPQHLPALSARKHGANLRDPKIDRA